MGNSDGMGFNRPVGDTEEEAPGPDRGLNTDRIVAPRTSRKPTYTLENAVVPCKDGLFHHPV